MASIFDMIGGNNVATQVTGTNATQDMLGFMRNPQVANSLKGMASQLQGIQGMQGGMGNMLNMMAQNNPQLKMITQMMNGGGNPQQMVQQKLKEMGIDEQQFMSELQSMMS